MIYVKSAVSDVQLFFRFASLLDNTQFRSWWQLIVYRSNVGLFFALLTFLLSICIITIAVDRLIFLITLIF